MEEEYGDEFLDDFGPAAKAKKLKKRKKKKKNKKELTPLEKMRDERLARKAGELVRRRRINSLHSATSNQQLPAMPMLTRFATLMHRHFARSQRPHL
eukprot:COSAG01_NODE_1281_length_10920_cov_39.473480_10_plen_97_part_00